jgi:hypothetical protein
MTRYGLSCPGIESRPRRDFPQPSISALGLTQPPIQWVLGLFSGVKRPGRGVDHHTTSSVDVKERVELHLYSPSGPSWLFLGWPLPLLLLGNIRLQTVLQFGAVQKTCVFRNVQTGPGSNGASYSMWPDSERKGKSGRWVKMATPLHLLPRLRINGV